MNDSTSKLDSDSIYVDRFAEFSDIIQHSSSETIQRQIQLLSDIIRENRIQFLSYFEIGLGDGRYSTHFGKLFKEKFICEPNKAFAAKIKELGFTVDQNKFLDFALSIKFDFCVCSHVLYYFRENEIEPFIEKVSSLKRSDASKIVVIMDEEEIVDRSSFETFSSRILQASINPLSIVREKFSIGPLIEGLTKMNIPFQEKSIEYEIQIKSASELEIIHSFFLWETKLNKEMLNESEAQTINSIIRQICEERQYPFILKRKEVFVIF